MFCGQHNDCLRKETEKLIKYILINPCRETGRSWRCIISLEETSCTLRAIHMCTIHYNTDNTNTSDRFAEFLNTIMYSHTATTHDKFAWRFAHYPRDTHTIGYRKTWRWCSGKNRRSFPISQQRPKSEKKLRRVTSWSALSCSFLTKLAFGESVYKFLYCRRTSLVRTYRGSIGYIRIKQKIRLIVRI